MMVRISTASEAATHARSEPVLQHRPADQQDDGVHQCGYGDLAGLTPGPAAR